VRLIADNLLANIMIVASDGNWLLHPYDGGMDVWVESRERQEKLQALFPAWLSPRPDGL
jgi:hypothetical protein